MLHRILLQYCPCHAATLHHIENIRAVPKCKEGEKEGKRKQSVGRTGARNKQKDRKGNTALATQNSRGSEAGRAAPATRRDVTGDQCARRWARHPTARPRRERRQEPMRDKLAGRQHHGRKRCEGGPQHPKSKATRGDQTTVWPERNGAARR